MPTEAKNRTRGEEVVVKNNNRRAQSVCAHVSRHRPCFTEQLLLLDNACKDSSPQLASFKPAITPHPVPPNFPADFSPTVVAASFPELSKKPPKETSSAMEMLFFPNHHSRPS
jgi:hypothetical protein